MKRIKHRANSVTLASEALGVGLYDGIECDVQFTCDGVPVLCHDAAKADDATNTSLCALQSVLEIFPDKLYLIEIKPCRWNTRYTGDVYECLEKYADRIVIISFSQAIVTQFTLYGFNAARVVERAGFYEMELPLGRASTGDITAEYLIS